PRKKRALAAPGACYDASQPRSCGAGRGERDGKGRTRIPFRHAPVPGWACYGPASSRRTRSAFEARQPLPRFLAVVRLKLRVEVRGHDHQVHEPLGIAPGSVVVLVGAREPLGMTDVKTDVVLYEVRDRIATLTLNRPDRLNAWTGGLARRYYSLLEDAAADPDVRVIVVTAAGRGWCAGADMDSLQGGGDSDDP